MDADWLNKFLKVHPEPLATVDLNITNKNAPTVLVTASTNDFQTFLRQHVKDAGALGEKALLVRPGSIKIKP